MNSTRCLCWREPFRNCCPVHRTKPRTATEAPPWLHRSDPPATSPRPVLWCLMWLQELSYLASREHPSFRSPLSGDLVDQSQPAGCCRHRSCRRAFLTVNAGVALPAEGFFKPIEGRALIGVEVPYENRGAVIGQIDCSHSDIDECRDGRIGRNKAKEGALSPWSPIYIFFLRG